MLRIVVVLLILLPLFSQACVVGPEKVEPSKSLGFEITFEEIDLCDACRIVKVKAPNSFSGKPVSHAIFSVFSNFELISKSVNKGSSKSGSSAFQSVVNLRDGISYKIEIEYGEGWCKSYQFSYSGGGIEI
jgi:hypothetical protein